MTNKLKQGILAAAISTLSFSAAQADIDMPKLFSDNMVLQQESRVALWGTADAGEAVSISSSWGAEAEGKASADGSWQLFLDTPAHQGKTHTVTVQGNNTLTFNNVALGEVWLMAGQSNAGWSVGSSDGAEEALKNADNPDLRIYRVTADHWSEPLTETRDLLAKWQTADAAVVEWTSAVGYYFASKVQKELGVPVGLIQTAYAGTPIEAWSPLAAQDPDLMTKIPPQKLKATEKDIAAARKKYDRELEEYKAKVANGQTTVRPNYSKPLRLPHMARPYVVGSERPGHVYNAMINPVIPYGIKGMVWYQGERNAKSPAQVINYGAQLEMMISHYRDTWHEQSEGGVSNDFPAFFTQLPSWFPYQVDPVEPMSSTWVISREQMLKLDNRLENTGMAVTVDTGSDLDLHPKIKKEIGIRHAYQALAKTYDLDFVADGPRYEDHEVNGNKMTLNFSSTGSGLMAAKDSAIDSFAIAGADQQWHWAEADIVGNSIVLSSPEVAEPVAVRYAWAMNPSQRNLIYNQEGIPASPFRTDDWPLIDDSSNADQVIKKPKKPKRYREDPWYRPEMTQ